MSTPVPAYFGAPEGLPVPLDAETPTKKGAGKKRKAKEPQPTRRSLRETRKLTPKAAAALAGEGEEEEAEEEWEEEEREAKALRSAKTATRPKRKPQATPQETAAELDAHNRNRISSMSEGQLRTRIKRITNLAKLKSFITALEASGMAALAGEARHKLAQLQGDAPEETFDAEYEPHASEEEQEEEEEEEWAPRRRR